MKMMNELGGHIYRVVRFVDLLRQKRAFTDLVGFRYMDAYLGVYSSDRWCDICRDTGERAAHVR